MLIGNKEEQDALRYKRPDEYHCKWLMRDSNACEALPAGIDGAEAGAVCPHNVHYHKTEVFAARDAAADTLERLFRLVGAAEAGLRLDLDMLSTTELLAAKSELNRQDSERMREAHKPKSSSEGLDGV